MPKQKKAPGKPTSPNPATEPTNKEETYGLNVKKSELTFVPSKPGELPVRTSLVEKASVVIMFMVMNLFLERVGLIVGKNDTIVGDRLFEKIHTPYTGALLLALPMSAVLFGDKTWAIPYSVAYVLPALTWWTCSQGIFYTCFLILFVFIPTLEIICGSDGTNPTQEEQDSLKNQDRFKYITMLWAPTQVIFLIWSLWFINKWDLGIIEFAFFIFSVGFNTGVLGINIAHELIHKNNKLEQFLGKVLLVTVCYGHFFIEHIWGHHRNVSTPYDPASSKYGESFYEFYPRTMYGSFRSAIEIEEKELHKKGLSFWSVDNRLLQLIIGSILCMIGSFVFFGPKGLILFVGQSFVAFSLLEIINYIEHYGLQRRTTPNKTKEGNQAYEQVNILHSWNADARLTNYFLFKLQRHSDHHAYASRRYQILRSFPESPQMPTGYAGMLVMALIPPLWFKIMNPRVRKFQDTLSKQALTE